VQRRADLMKHVGESEQVLFTTTDLNLFAPEFVERAKVWKISGGKVEK
jgi:recombinational DNA repair ATPase RecF